MTSSTARTIHPIGGIRGEVCVPGDKSISHRALMLGGLAEGTSRIEGWLRSADILSTKSCLEAVGVRIDETVDGALEVTGCPEWHDPTATLDCGNSGTTCRILSGALAGRGVRATLDGDESLRRRPMDRIALPLVEMGYRVGTTSGRLPMTLSPTAGGIQAIHYHSPVASAQVKSCVLLAGLGASGTTTVTEPGPSRDHTERMLSGFGAEVRTDGLSISIEGGQHLQATQVQVPGDFSSAAFLIAAGLMAPRGELLLRDVGLNPTRTGLLQAIAAMGVEVEVLDRREVAGEPVGDLRVAPSSLRGTRLEGDTVLRAIDEVPILAVLATAAEGETIIADAAELRVKESDRLAAMAQGLGRMGAHIEEHPDGLVIEGGRPLRGATVEAHGDHRIAMALAVAGLNAEGETHIRGAEAVTISFPEFFGLLEAIAE